MDRYEIMRFLKIERVEELIETIKLQGEPVEILDSVLQLPNDKLADREIMFFEEGFWVIYMVYSVLNDKVYWEDVEAFKYEWQARNYYDNLLQNLNAEIV